MQSIVELTLAVFGAKACSIMRFDAAARMLVFEAVAGEGAATLVGTRIASDTGIAGWSLASEEPISIDDVLSDPRFDPEVAARTGYIPRKLTVHPLLDEERSLGVLSVLDSGASAHFGLADMEVLARIATQASMALSAVEAARRAEAILTASASGESPLTRLARTLDGVGESRRAAAQQMIESLDQLLRSPPGEDR